MGERSKRFILMVSRTRRDLFGFGFLLKEASWKLECIYYAGENILWFMDFGWNFDLELLI